VKRFRFGLEKVLKVKQQSERIAEAKLAQARHALDLAQQHVDTVREQLQRVAASLERMVGRVLPPEQWAGTFEHSGQLSRALREAEVALDLARQHFEEAAQARRKIATEVETLKGLRRQQWEEHRGEEQKREQERLDELGMRRWSGNGRGDAS
jgi:flagellar export protein FliJ